MSVKAGLFNWRVSYKRYDGPWGGSVLLIEYLRADDVESALVEAMKVAERYGWVVKVVEQVKP